MYKTAAQIGFALSLSSLVVASGYAQANSTMQQPAAARKFFCGQVVALVEDHCIGVNSVMPPLGLYEITSANPAPAVGATISGSGIPGGISICQQGIHLSSVTWHSIHLCPLAKKR